MEHIIPLEYVIDEDDAEAGEIFINIFLNEIQVRMLLDSGSSRTLVENNEESRKLKSVGTYKVGGAFGDAIELDLVIYRSFKIGDYVQKDIELARFPKNEPKRSQIGMDILGKEVVCFDFPNKEIIINPGRKPKELFPLKIDKKGQPFIEMKIGLLSVVGTWDTGAGITCLGKHLIDDNPSVFEKLGTLGVQDAGEEVEQQIMVFRCPPSELSSHQFGAVRAVEIDLNFVNQKLEHRIDIILGYNFLIGKSWYFDFPASKWGLLN